MLQRIVDYEHDKNIVRQTLNLKRRTRKKTKRKARHNGNGRISRQSLKVGTKSIKLWRNGAGRF